MIFSAGGFSYTNSILMADDAVFIAAAIIRAVVERILNKQAHFVLVQVLLTDGIAEFFIVFKIHAVITFTHYRFISLFAEYPVVLDEIADTKQRCIDKNFDERQGKRQKRQQPNGAAAHEHLTQEENQISDSLCMPGFLCAGKAPAAIENKIIDAGANPCAECGG